MATDPSARPGTGDVAAASTGAAGSRSPVGALLVSLRPTQWVKNLALLAAPIFARRMTSPASLRAITVGIGAFCLLASAVYLLNDIVDRPMDSRHPRKRRRPVAAGELSVPAAGVAAVLVLIGGFALSATLGPQFVGVALSYVLLQLLYTMWLKNVVILDVFGIAAGFVLRVVAGAEAVIVPISNWLYLCTLFLSLLLALAKRRAELTLLGGEAVHHRQILAQYTGPMVDQLVSMLSACTVLAYALYTVSPETVQRFGSDHLKFTVPFVLFGLFRYIYLVHHEGAGGEPERVLLFDPPMQLNLLGYLATVAWVLYG